MSLLRPGTSTELSLDSINSLKSVGIRTVVDFLTSSPEEIAKICLLSNKVVSVIRKSLLAEHTSLIVTGSSLYNQVSQRMIILGTGIQRIDKLLDGGILSTEITELAGASATGKTQVCHAVTATTCVIPKHCVLYISSGADFSSERLKDLLTCSVSSEMKISEALEQVKCIQTFDVFQLLQVLHSISVLIHNDAIFYSNLKLLIIDSIAAVISPIISGKRIEGHGLMMQVAKKLKEIVEENVAVVVTNRVVQFNTNSQKPALGASWLHVPHTRILLMNRKHNDASSRLAREATVIKSIRQPLNVTTAFTIPLGPENYS